VAGVATALETQRPTAAVCCSCAVFLSSARAGMRIARGGGKTRWEAARGHRGCGATDASRTTPFPPSETPQRSVILHLSEGLVVAQRAELCGLVEVEQRCPFTPGAAARSQSVRHRGAEPAHANPVGPNPTRKSFDLSVTLAPSDLTSTP
jgi:hypothetical protein